jgi:hypothetical protein
MLQSRRRMGLRGFVAVYLTVVDILEYLPEIAHIEPLSAPGALHKVVGLGLG